MSTTTPNYNLLKPDETDFVDEDTALNDNWDIVDTELKANADAAVALDARVDTLETFDTAQAVINTSDDTRLDALEATTGTDSGWLIPNQGGAFTPLAGHTNVDSCVRRIGNIVDVHIRCLWGAGNLTPVAGGNVADTDIFFIDLYNFSVLQVQPRIYTGVIGQAKYIATFALDVNGAGEGTITLTQVDSNDEGNIVNGDVIGLDFTMFVEP